MNLVNAQGLANTPEGPIVHDPVYQLKTKYEFTNITHEILLSTQYR